MPVVQSTTPSSSLPLDRFPSPLVTTPVASRHSRPFCTHQLAPTFETRPLAYYSLGPSCICHDVVTTLSSSLHQKHNRSGSVNLTSSVVILASKSMCQHAQQTTVLLGQHCPTPILSRVSDLSQHPCHYPPLSQFFFFFDYVNSRADCLCIFAAGVLLQHKVINTGTSRCFFCSTSIACRIPAHGWSTHTFAFCTKR
ncbi:hypothetical protein IF2G_01445 [Cordyceps javanica]|nr:hypothetical protein IF2G_01445 [Cordyceps javanica]